MGVLLTAAAATGTLIPHEILARQLGGGSLNANPRSERIARLFTGIQVAATVGLFCAAGVAVDALWRQSTRDLGIGPGQVFQIDVHLGEETSKDAAASAWQRISTETLAKQPRPRGFFLGLGASLDASLGLVDLE